MVASTWLLREADVRPATAGAGTASGLRPLQFCSTSCPHTCVRMLAPPPFVSILLNCAVDTREPVVIGRLSAVVIFRDWAESGTGGF